MFGYNMDKKTIYIILGIIVLFMIINSNSFETMLLTLPGVIIAITFHEFAHAYMADKLGDTTPRSQGRLTLNPLVHIDPFGIILLMFAHVGWGRPVQINPNNFTSNKSKSTCEALVSLAGPVTNFIIALVGITIWVAIDKYTNITSYSIRMLIIVLQMIIGVNIGLGVFNLIPLPPLDGEKIFRTILPYNIQRWLDTNNQMLQLVFMILWITGLLSTVVAPVINIISELMITGVVYIFSLF